MVPGALLFFRMNNLPLALRNSETTMSGNPSASRSPVATPSVPDVPGMVKTCGAPNVIAASVLWFVTTNTRGVVWSVTTRSGLPFMSMSAMRMLLALLPVNVTVDPEKVMVPGVLVFLKT